MTPKRSASKRTASKKHFLVFCAIFLTVAVVLALGVWRTRGELERLEETRRSEKAPAPDATGSVRRLADPPPAPALAPGRS